MHYSPLHPLSIPLEPFFPSFFHVFSVGLLVYVWASTRSQVTFQWLHTYRKIIPSLPAAINCYELSLKSKLLPNHKMMIIILKELNLEYHKIIKQGFKNQINIVSKMMNKTPCSPVDIAQFTAYSPTHPTPVTKQVWGGTHL